MSTIAQVAWVMEGPVRKRPEARFTRLLMRRGETCRIDRRFPADPGPARGRLGVLRGGVDLLVPAGDSARVPASRKDVPVMSGVGNEVLVVELSG